MHRNAVIALVACAAAISALPTSAGEFSGDHQPGDRQGIHGMALFGKDTHYLAHIPMWAPPHNEQLILKVEIHDSNGAALKEAFHDQGYSLKPSSRFSLDDLALGKKQQFEADLFQGNFESGGALLHESVTINVGAVLVARNLDASIETKINGFIVGASDDLYLINRITRERNRQEINALTVDTDIPGQSDSAATPVSTKITDAGVIAVLEKSEDSEAPTEILVATTERRWCLVGDQFFEPCE